MLSPGTVNVLAYLPARRLAHTARKELVERNATVIDSRLEGAIGFARRTLEDEDSLVAETDRRLADIAAKNGFAGAEGDRSALTTPVLTDDSHPQGSGAP